MPVSSTDATGGDVGQAEIVDVNTASSSEADANTGVGSYEEAVEAALKAPEATPASEQGSKEPVSKDPTGAPPQADAEIPEDELEKYSKGAQRRIRELVEAKNTARTEVESFQKEIGDLKPKAEQLDQITGFMREHDITPEHLNNTLGITAMINRGEYDKVVPVLESLLDQVRKASGDVLPPDLQQQVDLGYITEAHAKELNKAKIANKRSEATAQQERARGETERQQREVNTLVTTVATAADAWNAEQVASDPDWNQKRDLVTEKAELELRRLGPQGYPRTDKDARALLDKVKKSVEAEIGRFRPAPKAIDNVTGRPVSPRSAAQPASYLDAVDAGLANARNG